MAVIRMMWAVDVEGSGMSPPEIVELAIVELDGLDLTGNRKSWRCRPRGGISPIASRIHGIRMEDVLDAPALEDIAARVHEWLEDRPIIGHNVRVDYDLLAQKLTGWQPQSVIDTLRLSRDLLPDQEKQSLQRLGADLGLDIMVERETGGTAHSALYDANLTARLFLHLIKPLSEGERDNAISKADILLGRQGSLW